MAPVIIHAQDLLTQKYVDKQDMIRRNKDLIGGKKMYKGSALYLPSRRDYVGNALYLPSRKYYEGDGFR